MGSFSVSSRTEGDLAILRARGYLSRNGGELLEREVVRLLGEGWRRFLVNFKDTDLINSVGVSILIGIIEQVRELGGSLYFSELNTVNEEIFRIMGLHRHARLVRLDGDVETGG